MAALLDHTIVPARDRLAAARFVARMFEVAADEDAGPFTPVRVNDGLTFEFVDAEAFEPHHYAFLVDDAEFDAIVHRVRTDGVPYGSGPEHGWNRQIDETDGVRRVYFQDPNGHSYEIFTRA